MKFRNVLYYNSLKEGRDIYRISSFLAGLMCRDKITEEEKVESCTYGIQITMANLINFVIAFSIGLIIGSLTKIALFYTIYVSLRFFCGGYHAKSYSRCFFLFAVTCLFYLTMLNGILIYIGNEFWLFIVAVILLGICILLKAPIEHTNRPFTAEERKLFRKRSIQLFLLWSVVGFVLWIWQMEDIFVGLISVFLVISIC